MRNKFLAEWASTFLGLSDNKKLKYINKVSSSEFYKDENKFVIKKIQKDFAKKNIKISFREIEFKIKDFQIKANVIVENKFKIFTQDMPDRAYVLELKMNQIADKEIALRINRTLAATKEFISQSRKKIAPYIEDCIGVENNE